MAFFSVIVIRFIIVWDMKSQSPVRRNRSIHWGCIVLQRKLLKIMNSVQHFVELYQTMKNYSSRIFEGSATGHQYMWGRL